MLTFWNVITYRYNNTIIISVSHFTSLTCKVHEMVEWKMAIDKCTKSDWLYTVQQLSAYPIFIEMYSWCAYRIFKDMQLSTLLWMTWKVTWVKILQMWLPRREERGSRWGQDHDTIARRWAAKDNTLQWTRGAFSITLVLTGDWNHWTIIMPLTASWGLPRINHQEDIPALLLTKSWHNCSMRWQYNLYPFSSQFKVLLKILKI